MVSEAPLIYQGDAAQIYPFTRNADAGKSAQVVTITLY